MQYPHQFGKSARRSASPREPSTASGAVGNISATKRIARAQIDELATRGRPDVFPLLSPDPGERWNAFNRVCLFDNQRITLSPIVTIHREEAHATAAGMHLKPVIHPCRPTVARRPPARLGWVHERKHDGLKPAGALSGLPRGLGDMPLI